MIMILIQRWLILFFSILLLCGIGCADKSKFKSQVTEQAVPAPAQTPSPQPAPAVDSGDSGEAKKATYQDKFKVSLKVDVIFAVDTSPTMDGEIAATKANLGRLISALNAGKLDHRIHLLIDTPFPLPAGADPKKIAFVAQRVSSADAISRMNALLEGMFAAFYVSDQNVPLAAPLPLRAEAKTEVVVISDDNGQGMGNLAADFNVKGVLKNYTFNSIVGLANSTVGDNCRLASVGMEYTTLSQKTGGSILDLCSPDWTQLITRLSADIVKRNNSFVLTRPVTNAKEIQAMLNGKQLLEKDFAYEPGTKTLTLNTLSDLNDGAELIVRYTVQ